MSLLTIYFHKDFDGFVAAALFLRINEESELIGADGIKFNAVDYDLKKTWLKTVLERPNVVIDFLKDIHKPIGVSEYAITRNLPEEFKSSLPSIEEIEAELKDGK